MTISEDAATDDAAADATDLVTLTSRAARVWGHEPAWEFDATGERFTFAEVDDTSTKLAGALRDIGVRPGDRVAVMVRNQPEFPLLWLALAKVGGTLVPINVNYQELDATHVLRHSGARFAVAAEEFHPLLGTVAAQTSLERILTLSELAARRGTRPILTAAAGEAPANIQYTSGTTGAPKGCVLPHRYWTTLARSMVAEFPAITDRDTILTAQPFHYVDPQWNVAVGLASGAKLVVLDRFHPSTFWDKVRAYRVTWFYCLAMMPTSLLRTPESEHDHAHQVRAIHCSAIPRESHAALERRWGVPWFEAFGMTETGADVRVSPTDHDDTVGTGCIGRPSREREVIIGDADGNPLARGKTGELLIRGIGIMHGYHNDHPATEQAFRSGWLHTGDLATMDAKGRVYYVGRSKDMIRRSGENISADEVERALLLHPDVELAAVIGVGDDLRGEELKAYIVTRSGTGSFGAAPAELAEFCAGKLAYYKVPRYWAYPDSLPLTASERVAKAGLREPDGDPRRGSYDRVDATWR